MLAQALFFIANGSVTLTPYRLDSRTLDEAALGEDSAGCLLVNHAQFLFGFALAGKVIIHIAGRLQPTAAAADRK